MFLREVTWGMHSGSVTFAGTGEFRPNDDITIGHRAITRKDSRWVARAAFEIARKRTRKRVTTVHKVPIFRLACGIIAEECRKVAQEYPDVSFGEGLVDGGNFGSSGSTRDRGDAVAAAIG